MLAPARVPTHPGKYRKIHDGLETDRVGLMLACPAVGASCSPM
jgi:hypothetical protein